MNLLINQFNTYKLIISFLIFWTPLNISASIIEHQNYTFNNSSNYVTDGSYDWLRWDQTLNLSIYEVQTNLYYSGWRVASNLEMLILLNDFFPALKGTDDESVYYSLTGKYSEDDSAYIKFLDMFGYSSDTQGGCYLCERLDHNRAISIFFGSDDDKDYLYNYASLSDKTALRNTVSGKYFYSGASVGVAADYYSYVRTNPFVGVALIRDVTKVNEPNTFIILVSCLIILLVRHFKPLISKSSL
jgi:hypothetical protein